MLNYAMHGMEASHNPSSSNLQKTKIDVSIFEVYYTPRSSSFLSDTSFLLSRFLCKSKVRVFRLLSKWPRRAILRSGEIIDLKVIPLIYFRNQGIKFFVKGAHVKKKGARVKKKAHE